jgi:hypothetical protein
MGEAGLKLRVLSLGAGVQSTTLALMAARGEIGPMPDCAIFADTGWEPKHVYEHLDRLEKLLPFPVYRVSQGDLRSTIGGPKGKYLVLDIPVYVSTNGVAGGMTNRSCTRDYKISPIQRKVRELVGLTRKRSPKEPIVEQWIGISLDETIRMKPNREAWIRSRWPLIEQRMTRNDCLRWMERNGFEEPKKSSCIGCPYHSDAEWRAVKADPQAWADAIEIDERLRSQPAGAFRLKGDLYLHRSCKPLAEVDLSTAEERGQLNLFLNECEGMCGV